MKASPIALTAMLATGQLLATANGVLAVQLGGAAEIAAIDGPPPFILQVQGEERLDRVWQHRSIIEHALQAPPEASAERPPPLPTARPTVAVLDQLAETSQGVSCEEAARIVADYGFSAIRQISCSGDVYRFSATRDSTAYSVGIAAAAGEITEVSRE